MQDHKHSLVILFFLSVLCLDLAALRVTLTSDANYWYFLWNLFLAWIPLGFSVLINYLYRTERKITTSVVVLSGFWLLFYPNALYLVTDIIHLGMRALIPFWIDLTFMVILAWMGMYMAFLSMQILQKIINAKYGEITSWIFVLITTGLGSLGVFLGRFLRWNSWDIVINPFEIVYDIFIRILNPFSNKRFYFFTLIFSILSMVSYLVFYNLQKSNSGFDK